MLYYEITLMGYVTVCDGCHKAIVHGEYDEELSEHRAACAPVLEQRRISDIHDFMSRVQLQPSVAKWMAQQRWRK